LNFHFSALQVMNRKLLTTNNAENEATDGKQCLQKPEDVKNAEVENGAVAANGVAPREQTAVVENGAVAVAANGVAPEDANPTTKVVAVANGC
jgi:YTH domain-containing family protein